MPKSESQLQREVLAHCQGHPLIKFMLRTNSGKVKVKGGWMQLCATGTADLNGMTINGIWIAIEMKDEAAWNSTNHGASDEQVAFLESVRDSGGLSGIACSVEHAERIIHGEHVGLTGQTSCAD